MKNKLLILILLFLLMPLAGCDKNKEQVTDFAVPVLAKKVIQKDFPVSIDTVGTIEAYKTVDVYSQADGRILKIYFKEGQHVKKGDLLFLIDPAMSKEKLRQSEADLIAEKAILDFNEKEAKRNTFLYKKGAIAKSDYDKSISDYENQKNVVLSKKAAVAQNQTNLNYSNVYAPFTGKTSYYFVHEGAIIQGNITKLVNINQISPVYLNFSVPGSFISLINHFKKKNLPVIAYSESMADQKRTGHLVFIDNSIDPATGLIKLKAIFENKDNFFWPGEFLKVSFFITTIKNTIIVPIEAVQISEDGQYVFVIKPDLTIEKTPIEIIKNNDIEAAVSGNIKVGNLVVTDGFLNLVNGGKVKIKESLE